MPVTMSTIREVKQLNNCFVIFCFLQVACIVLTAGLSVERDYLYLKVMLIQLEISAASLIKAFDIGLNSSKYCKDELQWTVLSDHKEIQWTEQGEKHKSCPDVPRIVPGVWTVPLVIACTGKVSFSISKYFTWRLLRTLKVLIKLGSLTSLNRYVALITVAFVSCLVSSTATVGQVAIIHRSLNFSYTPVGTIIFCLYMINGLSLFGILCVSIGCMIIAARLICSRKDSVHFNNRKLRVFIKMI